MSLRVPKAQLQVTKKFDSKQTLKAATALARHLEQQRDETKVEKASLLADDDEENKNSKLDVPLWLLITAKEHLATSHSLQPGKVTVPHPIYSSPQTRICLITADPPASDEKAYKNLVKHKLFPKDLGEKIHKVVGYTKLAKKYKSYESKRQLLSEYDVFLVDERVARLVPAALGKVFYSSPTKRPLPVSLTGKENWGKKEKKTAYDRLKPKNRTAPTTIGKPEDVATDIEKALATLAIHLSPSPTLSIKVAYASWPAEWIQENVDAVVDRVVLKYVPNKWNGLKSLFLKGPETAALPIWMADELWRDETDVLDEGEKETGLNMTKRTKEERLQRKELNKEKKLKRLADVELPVAEGKKRKRVPLEEEAAPTKKSKKTLEPVQDEAVVEPKKAKGKQKRKADDSEEDEEFEKAQEIHKKLKAKKAKVVAEEPAVEEVVEAPTEAAKPAAKAKLPPVVTEVETPAPKETKTKSKPAAKEKDVSKKHKKGNMSKGQPKPSKGKTTQ